MVLLQKISASKIIKLLSTDEASLARGSGTATTSLARGSGNSSVLDLMRIPPHIFSVGLFQHFFLLVFSKIFLSGFPLRCALSPQVFSLACLQLGVSQGFLSGFPLRCALTWDFFSCLSANFLKWYSPLCSKMKPGVEIEGKEKIVSDVKPEWGGGI
jgi:hypothetical protein